MYSLVEGSESHAAIRRIGSSIRLFASERDLAVRGVRDKVAPEAKVIDYDRMVKLMMREYGKVVSYL